jgi:hypothetical protein
VRNIWLADLTIALAAAGCGSDNSRTPTQIAQCTGTCKKVIQ